MDNSQFDNFFRDPNVSIKGAFYGHLIFMSWALLVPWSPDAYLFYNLIFIILILWGIASKGNLEPLEMAQIVNVICLIMDIFVISIYFPRGGFGIKMSAVMAILNLLLRPLTFTVLRHEIQYRRDGGTSNFPNTFGSHYQDIDATPGTP